MYVNNAFVLHWQADSLLLSHLGSPRDGGAKLLQLCLTLCYPMDCSPPGFSVHGILQARTLEWVAISSPRGSSQTRDQTLVTYVSCMAGRFCITSAIKEGSPNISVLLSIFPASLAPVVGPRVPLQSSGTDALWGSPDGAMVKNPLANAREARDAGSIPGLGRSPGKGNGNPLPYSCLENPMDREAWLSTVHGVTKRLN